VILAQTVSSSALLVVVGAVITGVVGYLVSTVQFKRQQKVDHERWLREQRLSAYRQLTETLRSSSEIMNEALLVDGPTTVPLARVDASLSLDAALNAAHLVGGLQVTDAVQAIRNTMWDLEQEGPGLSTYQQLVSQIGDLDWAMRDEVQGDLAT
jgi:hypothetical protein